MKEQCYLCILCCSHSSYGCRSIFSIHTWQLLWFCLHFINNHLPNVHSKDFTLQLYLKVSLLSHPSIIFILLFIIIFSILLVQLWSPPNVNITNSVVRMFLKFIANSLELRKLFNRNNLKVSCNSSNSINLKQLNKKSWWPYVGTEVSIYNQM